jgi:hypothetical protein
MYCQYNESRMGSVFSEMILLSIALVAFHVHLSKVSTRDWEDMLPTADSRHSARICRGYDCK